MPKTRLFLHTDSLESVLCEWNEVTGSWQCSCSSLSQYQFRASYLQPLVKQLRDDGFQELRPNR